MIQSLILLCVVGGFLFFSAIIALIVYRRGLHIPNTDEVLVIVAKDKHPVINVDEIDGDVVEAIRDNKDDTSGFRLSRGRVWVNPVTSKVFPLKVDSRKTSFEVNCYDTNKVAVNIAGEILFKVGDSDQAVKAAATRFMNAKPEELNNTVEGLTTGQLRALVGELTISQLLGDRQLLQKSVKEQVFTDMARLGLQVDAVVLRDIDDENDFIKNLGVPEEERVAQEASVARDNARREREIANQAAELEIARVKRDTEVKAAEYAAERDRAKATSEQSGPLARAEAEVKVIEKETAVAQKRASMKEQLLDAEVKKAADAKAYAIKQIAGANKEKVELEAEAQSTRILKLGKAQASAFQEKGKALAGQHGESIIQQRLVEQMPQIVRAASEPYAAIDNMVVADPDNIGEAIIAAISNAGKAVQTARGLSTPKDVQARLAPIEDVDEDSLYTTRDDGSEVEVDIPEPESIELPDTKSMVAEVDEFVDAEADTSVDNYTTPEDFSEEDNYDYSDSEEASAAVEDDILDNDDVNFVIDTINKVNQQGIASYLASSGGDLPRLVSIFHEIRDDASKLSQLDSLLTSRQQELLHKLIKRF